MKTEDLIGMLSAQSAVDAPARHRTKIACLVLASVGLSLGMMLQAVGLNPNLLADMALPMFWLKIGGSAILAVLYALAVMRAGTPGRGLGRAPFFALALIGALWLAAAWQGVHMDADERLSDVQGVSWQECSAWIAYLSTPFLAVLLYAQTLRAPTQPALAGALCGAASGALGAAVYALHCPEYAVLFLAVWYVLGMAIPVLVGTVLGAKLLRW